LLKMAEHLSRFVQRLFGVEKEAAALVSRAGADKPVFKMKTDFLARRTFRKGQAPRAKADDFPALDALAAKLMKAAPELSGGKDAEHSVARVVGVLMEVEKSFAAARKLQADGGTPQAV